MQILNIQIPDVNARKNFATVTAAIAVAYALELPVGQHQTSDNPYASFDAAYEDTAKKILCELNETAVISIRDALELTRKLWVQRYNMVYRPLSINPVTLVAAVTAADEQSVGNEFVAYSQAVKVATPLLLKEAAELVDKAFVLYSLAKTNPDTPPALG